MVRLLSYSVTACASVAVMLLVSAPLPAHSDATAALMDPVLNADSRFSATGSHSEKGTGQEEGVYLPTISSAQSEITGTVLNEPGTSGPTDFYIGAVDKRGNKYFWKSLTDENGRFHFVPPLLAGGIVSLFLFRHFDHHGQPDAGSACQIANQPVHLEGLRPLANVPQSGPAILESATAYERGATANNVLTLHTRAISPLDARILMDGSDSNISTLASSDQSVVGQLSEAAPFGRHAFVVASAGSATNAALAVVVSTRFDPMPHMRPGQVLVARLHIDGLANEKAIVTFTVTGAASVARGGTTQVVEVADGVATCLIRANRPGQLLIRTNVEVESPPILAETLPSPGAKPSSSSPEPRKSAGTTGVTIEASPSPSPSFIPIRVTFAAPSPTPTCAYSAKGGPFEATQGAWQDDQIYRPKPIELKRYSSDQDPMRLYAPMPMVANRRTLLFGADYYLERDGGEATPRARNYLEFKVNTNCSFQTGVYIHFEAFEGKRTIWSADSKPLDTVPLSGPPLPTFSDYSVILPMTRGFPDPPSTLIFQDLGYAATYGITAELRLTSGGTTGAQSFVTGKVVATHGPNVHIVPVILSKPQQSEVFLAMRHRLNVVARKLADDIGYNVPDLFPLSPGGNDGTGSMPTIAEPPLDLSTAGIPLGPEGSKMSLLKSGVWASPSDRLLATLSDNVQTRAMLAGAGRVIVLLNENDYPLTALREDASAFTVSSKLIVAQPENTWETMAHELIHTLPFDWTFVPTRPKNDQWIVSWMLSECNHEYHNKYLPGAYGVDYLYHGQDLGPRFPFQNITRLIMGPTDTDRELCLCDFNHLVNVLQSVPDPPVLMVRAFAARAGDATRAEFASLYTMDGTFDLKPSGVGSWALVVHDAMGSKEYRFEPHWRVPDLPHDLKLIALNYRIPEPLGAALLELLAGKRVLASARLSAARPFLRIIAPADGATIAPRNGLVDVSWVAQSSERRTMRASVLYSKDGGKNYETQLFEITGTQATVSIDPSTPHHVVKVIVTDGTRSTEQVVHFTTP